jgi:hypothetical protein
MKLRTTILGSTLAAAMVLTAGAASATTNIGDLSTAPGNQLLYGTVDKVSKSGLVNDIYNFTVSTGVLVTSLDLINSLKENTAGKVTGGELFTSGSISLDSGFGASGPTLLSGSFVTGTDTDGNAQVTANAGSVTLTPGSYSLDVVGTANPFTSGKQLTYSGSVVGVAVPEPATWAVMFVGFGAIGASMRRSRRRTAAATA